MDLQTTEVQRPAPRLALQLWTVRESLAVDRDGTLACVAAAGFDAVEPFGIGDPARRPPERLDAARALRRTLDRLGLDVCSAHAWLPSGEALDAVLDEVEALGSDLIVAAVPEQVGDLTRSTLGSSDGVARLAEALGQAGARAAARGIRVGYHNHFFEWAAVENGASAFDRLVAELDSRVFIELDLYWAHVAGQDPARLAERLGERVVIVHVKDGPGSVHGLQTTLGTGVVALEAALRVARHARWQVVEIDACAGDPLAVAADGLAWLRRRQAGRT